MKKSVLKTSVSLYGFLLNFYPKNYKKQFGEEMKYVFSESLKENYSRNGGAGVFRLWFRTLLDTLKSLFREHLENQEGVSSMKKDIIQQNKIFAFIALGTAVILSLPYLAMKFNWVKPDPSNPLDQGVNWSVGDFFAMGILLFGSGSLFVLVARTIPSKYRLLLAAAFIIAFLLIWAHLAVGIVDSWPLAGS